jgi:hypothetical protein
MALRRAKNAKTAALMAVTGAMKGESRALVLSLPPVVTNCLSRKMEHPFSLPSRNGKIQCYGLFLEEFK